MEISGTVQVVGVSAIVIALVLTVFFARRGHSSHTLPMMRTGSMPKVPPQGIIYHDAPTVRVTQHDRFNRVQKKISLAIDKPSDPIDLKQPGIPPLRLDLKAVAADHAQVMVDLGGIATGCGPLVRENVINDFTMPVTAADDHRGSVFYFRESEGTLLFIRIVLVAIDRDANTADFNVLMLNGMWHAQHN